MRITRRDMFAVAVADEATMAQLDKYRQFGKGHVVMFANRPYWRWQTQGDFFLGFNAILNWNDLDAGRAPARPWDRRRSNNVERFRRHQHQAQSAGRDPILNTAACRGATQGLHAARTG
jgi:hypothetical protein